MPSSIQPIQLGVFAVIFVGVALVGVFALHWRKAESLNNLDEWGLGGRNFGGIITWFLLGGDLYTAYTFIAVPALVYGVGQLGFFTVPYTIVLYPFAFVVMPRLWSAAHRHGYVTPADFVRGRYGSNLLALVIAVTGIISVIPYVALQLYGIRVVFTAMGLASTSFGTALPLGLAFAILAIYTFNSGLRAPALTAFLKDGLIYAVVIVAVIYIPLRIGGYAPVFNAASRAMASKPASAKAAFITPPAAYSPYATLAFGSALALFMYPHNVTGVLAAKTRNTVRRNMAALPAYTLLLGFIALLGYMAYAVGIHVSNNNLALPRLFQVMFPDWFVGIAFAAIGIGALVPAAIMAIAAANLFSRNIWLAYVNRDSSARVQTWLAKIVSVCIAALALVFILSIKTTFILNFQLLGGVWILQTFPAIVFGLYTRWFHRWSLVLAWAAGIGTGTAMAASNAFASSVYAVHLGPLQFSAYAGLIALAVNILVLLVLDPLVKLAHLPAGVDETRADDYEADRSPAESAAPRPAAAGPEAA
ncbi:MAG TPA: sodium:solute symporter [Segeticoccus sp.]|uniref:monocarboxylate uptake permease MctP n=1 Tax=Segeticoccus sp. TaxID=2706531 RepID=UPI002D7FDA81|nr:sodium:solute symporter [Segeticoccus sp.]HET8601350.1 sodium:solute symporter [Segeticoccus sp.]